MKCVPFIKIFVSINKFHIFLFLFLLFILYGLGIEPRVLHMGDKCFCCICCYDKNTLEKKSNVGKEKNYLAYTFTSQSFPEEGQSRNSVLELEVETMEEMLLAALFPVS